jgi:hypothetical protein
MEGHNKKFAQLEPVPFNEIVRLFHKGPKDFDPWRPLHPSYDRILLEKPTSEEQLRRLGELLAGRPDVELRFVGFSVEDLEFLRYFPVCSV